MIISVELARKCYCAFAAEAGDFDGVAVTVTIITVEFPDSGERKCFAFTRCKGYCISIAAEFGMLELVDIGMDFIGIHTLRIVSKADDQRFIGIIGNGVVVCIDDDLHLGIAGCSSFCCPVSMDIQEPGRGRSDSALAEGLANRIRGGDEGGRRRNIGSWSRNIRGGRWRIGVRSQGVGSGFACGRDVRRGIGSRLIFFTNGKAGSVRIGFLPAGGGHDINDGSDQEEKDDYQKGYFEFHVVVHFSVLS